jgi:hypothetical protein
MIPRRTTPLFRSVSLGALLLVAMAARAADPRPDLGFLPWESVQLRRSTPGYPPLIPAQDTVWCFCPAVLCSHGRMAGCTASCYAPKSPLCRCEAQCDLYEKPVGSNLCRCE